MSFALKSCRIVPHYPQEQGSRVSTGALASGYQRGSYESHEFWNNVILSSAGLLLPPPPSQLLTVWLLGEATVLLGTACQGPQGARVGLFVE